MKNATLVKWYKLCGNQRYAQTLYIFLYRLSFKNSKYFFPVKDRLSVHFPATGCPTKIWFQCKFFCNRLFYKDPVSMNIFLSMSMFLKRLDVKLCTFSCNRLSWKKPRCQCTFSCNRLPWKDSISMSSFPVTGCPTKTLCQYSFFCNRLSYKDSKSIFIFL